jgi:hypothetical protein
MINWLELIFVMSHVYIDNEDCHGQHGVYYQ